MRYERGLDGLRALAVLAVVFFHGDFRWIPGGFLGVDVFFVVSGYLITSLMIEEWHTSGTVVLRQFWLRRARRLLPALFAMLVTVCVVAALAVPDAISQLRSDAIAAVAYVTNWWLIADHQSYFAALGRPPLLRHLWSLAVEEQWYLVWPPVFVFAMRRVGGRARRLAPFALVLAVASAVWMAWLFDPAADPSRVYFGTDTRISGLLLGAAMAMVWAPWRWRGATGQHRVVLDVIGAAAIAGLAAAVLLWGEDTAFLYHGGFFVVAVLSVLVVATVVHPGSLWLRVALGWGPLMWIGRRSYAIYLWHWPIFVILRPQDLHVAQAPAFAIDLAVTLALSELSFRLVETPIRTRGLRAVLPDITWATAARLAAAVFVVGAISVRFVTAPRYDPLTGQIAVAVAVPAAAAEDFSSVVSAADPAATDVATSAAVAPTGPARVIVVGDSQGHTLVVNAPRSLAATMTLLDGYIDGCGVLDEGSMSSTAHFSRSFTNCVGWSQRWAARARETQADVALVVIGAWEVFDIRQTPTGDYPFGVPRHLQYLRDKVTSGVEALKSAGAKVALLQVPCYRPVDGGGLKALPERNDDIRTGQLNDVLRDVANADPNNVVFVETPKAFCQSPTDVDRAMRWDGVHYYSPGAKLVFDTIGPSLLRLSGR